MIDGVLETLDLTLFKRGMFEFASYVFFDVGWLEMDRFFDFFCVFKKICSIFKVAEYTCYFIFFKQKTSVSNPFTKHSDVMDNIT